MKTYFLVSLMFITSSVMAQRLRDSLFGGRLKVDTGKTFVSKDTGKYVAPKVYDGYILFSYDANNNLINESYKSCDSQARRINA